MTPIENLSKQKEEDYKMCGLPEEISILEALPEDKRNLVFNLAGKQTHCQNIDEWLVYLKDFVAKYDR